MRNILPRLCIKMMLIDDRLMSELLGEASRSPRLRMNKDLRNSPDDLSQRMLNALLPGTILPIHRHRTTSETVVILKGSMQEIFYDDDGLVAKEVLLKHGGACVGLNIPQGTWHTVRVLEPTVILEVKDGAYEPTAESDILYV